MKNPTILNNWSKFLFFLKKENVNLGLLKEWLVLAGVQTHTPKVYMFFCGAPE